MKKLHYFIEKQIFGVCAKIGQKMGISSNIIRLYFIYLSFITLGSPIVVYLFVAFWLNIKNYLRKGYNTLDASF